MFCFLATIKVAPDTSTLAGGKVEGGGNNNEAQRAPIKLDDFRISPIRFNEIWVTTGLRPVT
jgi:hypothetical protein